MDARHVFPKVFDNAAFAESQPLWDEVRECASANDCIHCGKCAELMRRVFH